MDILRPDGREPPENHHLEFRPDKGDFRMKVTVEADDKRFIGHRILVPLHTRDITVARQIRDGIIIALSKAGVLSRPILLNECGEESQGDNSRAGNPDQAS